MATQPLEIKLKTLTPLWTGGIDGTMDRIHETSIIGSLRWWYEAIVRGLEGWACDPTDTQSCPDKEEMRCAVCELFGCTNWQRKFKLLILDKNKSIFNLKPGKDELVKDMLMIWKFIELHPICDEEKWLLYQAIHIASEYGAIGGRTPRKPQGNKKVGGDYGLIVVEEKIDLPHVTIAAIKNYLKRPDLRRLQQTKQYPDLRYFFFVTGQYLRRKLLNRLLGLSEDGKSEISSNPIEIALRGRVGISKKVFSFETYPERMWGYLPNAQLLNDTTKQLNELGIDKQNIKTGQEVLNEL